MLEFIAGAWFGGALACLVGMVSVAQDGEDLSGPSPRSWALALLFWPFALALALYRKR